jgi:hypothetical protein
MHYENVSEKEMSVPQNGRLNNMYITITTLNTKTTNNKEKIHEFHFKAAKTEFF